MTDCPWVQESFQCSWPSGLRWSWESGAQSGRGHTPSLGEMPGLTLLDEGSANAGFLHLQRRSSGCAGQGLGIMLGRSDCLGPQALCEQRMDGLPFASLTC